MVQTGAEVAVAFGLTILSGAATSIGASVVFFPGLLRLTTKKALSAACGIAGGVMLYVSFAEVFHESVAHFNTYGLKSGVAYSCATICFFSGIFLIMLLDIFTSWLLGGHTHNESQANVKSSQVDEEDQGSSDSDNNTKELAPVDEEHNIGDVSGIITGIEKKKLMQMSLNTGLAIAIHNFPEGVATFVAAMDNPRVGAIFAIAIAIHNIPEGFAIALPIYYGTGNPWKAFFWGALSGATEPVAAFFAWLVLGDNMGDITFGVVFGVVAGMMVMVAVQELLPAAHRYDPDDEVASKSLVGGMAFMALSLILFAVTE